jgi:hypothetical protein
MGGRNRHTPGDPVYIPHDNENRGVATGIDPEPNQQVSGPNPPPPQVTEPPRLNLSRWRHGFEPRWDYQGKRIVAVFVSTLVKVQTWAFRRHRRAGQPG